MNSGQMRALVSVLVAARNEEANIAACLQSLLSQGEDVEILVADDSSEDATAELVREQASRAGNLRLVTVPALPPGWLGKNHALHVAVDHSTGDWLLFTDADTRHAAGTLKGMIEWAEKAKLDLASLSPRQEAQTWWERAVIPLLYHRLARLYPYERVNDPANPLAAANGQYILIRREVYFRLGGHEAIRGELLEDVALALRAKQAGCRIWFGPGDGVVRTRMYRRFSEMWQGWTKNLFLIYHRDRGAIHREAGELAVRYLLPPLAAALLFMAGLPYAWFGIAPLAWMAWEHIRYTRSLKVPERWAVAAWLVPGAFLLFLLLLNSERRYSRNLEVEWKGRRYPTGQ
ncbi:MAG TPA: glycosyltransferase [Terriglobia bacterium]